MRDHPARQPRRRADRHRGRARLRAAARLLATGSPATRRHRSWPWSPSRWRSGALPHVAGRARAGPRRPGPAAAGHRRGRGGVPVHPVCGSGPRASTRWRRRVVLIVVVLAGAGPRRRAGRGGPRRPDRRAVRPGAASTSCGRSAASAPSIGATGVLIALAAPIMGYWALPVFAVPLLLTQFAFRRYATIASHLPADHPLAVPGHRGRRLHRDRPLPPGQPARRGGRSRARHERARSCSTWSTPRSCTTSASSRSPTRSRAAPRSWPRPTSSAGSPSSAPTVIRQTGRARRGGRPSSSGRPSPTAARTRTRRGGSRWPAGSSRPSTPTTTWSATRIETGRRLEALERLRLGMAYEYDPRVVDSLSRIVDRSTRF